jgi:hypothetical protein
MTKDELRAELASVQERLTWLASEVARLTLEAAHPPETSKIESVYRRPLSELNAPDGWEFTGEFREPTLGEPYLWERGPARMAMADFVFPRGPRLILRRRPPEPTIESVYGHPLTELCAPDGWLFTGEFRAPRIGDVFFTSDFHSAATAGYERSFPRLILCRKTPEPTIESVYGKPFAALTPPRGWRWKRDAAGEPEFRRPVEGEFYLSTNGLSFAQWVSASGPRLLLVRAERLVFDILGERVPHAGEWCQSLNTQHIWCEPVDGTVPRRILSAPRVEEAPE